MRPKKKRKWKLKLFFMLLALWLALMISVRPAALESAAPTGSEVNAARALFERVTRAGDIPGDQQVSASWSELRAVTALGGRAAGIRRVELERLGETGRVTASVPLLLGLWANVQIYAKADEDRALRLSGKIGRVPVPSLVAHGAFGVVRTILGWRGANIPPLETMIHTVALNDQGIAAVVDLPKESKLFSALSGLRPGGIDADRVANRYCALVEMQRSDPSYNLTDQIHRAFADGDGSVVENRSSFVALAMLTASTKVGQLAGGTQAIVAKCGKVDGDISLMGRADLAKHWTVSAALTSAFGSDASIAMGTWKEISDSDGGSGFSLVDLAADRSGTFTAQRSSDSGSAEALQKWLSTVSEDVLLPVSALALAEGMTEAEFQSRYASTDSSAYAATVARIDETLASVIRP